MCRDHEQGVTADAAQRPVRGAARRRLWEVHHRFLCAVIGTCLPLVEVRRIAIRDRLATTTTSDYDVHGAIVKASGTRNPTSRALHKLLERRYKASVRGFASCRTEQEVVDRWGTRVDEGDYAGPYWALMTHPETGPRAIERAFGDIHMLSHLQGAARRADQRKLGQARTDAGLRQQRARKVKEQLRTVREALQLQTAQFGELEARHAVLLDEVRSLRSGALGLSTARERDALVRRVAEQEARLTRYEGLVSALEDERLALTAANDRLEQALRDGSVERDALLEEVAAAEHHLTRLSREEVDEDSCDGCPMRSDLGGRSVLYVGGRIGLLRHYRTAVEACGGELVHHDGGIEDCPTRLDALVQGASLVVCPVDAVSHDAALRAKRACKRDDRRFVPLRSAGVASLVTAIEAATTGSSVASSW